MSVNCLFTNLQEGQEIVFKRRPSGSWVTEGVVYIVEWKDSHYAYFRNKLTGGGTYDRDWAINMAELAA